MVGCCVEFDLVDRCAVLLCVSMLEGCGGGGGGGGVPLLTHNERAAL